MLPQMKMKMMLKFYQQNMIIKEIKKQKQNMVKVIKVLLIMQSP